MSENLRGGQRPENWLGRIMSENIQGGQCPGIKGEQCPEGDNVQGELTSICFRGSNTNIRSGNSIMAKG